MLKSGIPLEPALAQLCSTMRRGTIRTQLELLQTDLSQGTPFSDALAKRDLPEFYKQMVRVGVKSNNLPAVLTMLADYYQKTHILWTRMKTLLIYPTIVLAVSFGLSALLVVLYYSMAPTFAAAYMYPWPYMASDPTPWFAAMLIPVMLLGCAVLAVLIILCVPLLRRKMRWKMPGFKEAHLSRLSTSLGLLVDSGCDLKSALALLRLMETGTGMEAEIARWESRLQSGVSKFSDIGAESKIVPPLFFWMVGGQGEDLGKGLAAAGQMYYQRAIYRADIFLQAVLPVSVIGLGLVILMQMDSVFNLLSGNIVGAFQSMGSM